jgi:Fe-S cluster assembly protein SufD
MKTVLKKVGEVYSFNDLLIVIDGESVNYDLEVVLDAAQTEAKIINKAIVTSGGYLEMKGLIKMTKKAELGRADLTQKVLLLGENAHASAEPELEIENNEVKATHAASVGQLDKRQLEFLMRRGFDKKQAVKILIRSFIDDILQTLEQSKRNAIENKLQKLYEQI